MNKTSMSTKVFVPKTIEEAFELKHSLSEKGCVALGATWLQLQWEKTGMKPQNLISLEQVIPLQEITAELIEDQLFLSLGAAVNLSSCRRNPLIQGKWPALSRAVSHVASPGIRNKATIGGNVAIKTGDIIPLLLVMDATIVLYTTEGYVRTPLAEWLENNREDCLITRILIPREENRKVFYHKIGRRKAFIGSSVVVSGSYEKDNQQKFSFIRLIAGHADIQAQRLYDAEKKLLNKRLAPEMMKDIYQTMISEFQPMPDAFLSADYRKKAAANLLMSELVQ
ncbi:MULTISPECIES: FAD binding domain-containing protein [Bacillus]|nr:MULTISPECIES: FAD binding domain-containing protein [Bacillus]MBP1081126.1 xanthine dehydrogenase C subunit [Bacillus capparidis]MED1095811.1 FAD binding domain-containing protein [Bacillus capparidis]